VILKQQIDSSVDKNFARVCVNEQCSESEFVFPFFGVQRDFSERGADKPARDFSSGA
jgi:hypothetical protein